MTFPVSTLSPDAGAELVAYAWIFPNVVPNGHWWYSNIPAYIAADLKARLQAVPKTKLVGYYSDAYKLEFVLPKFNMFRRVLAETLADDAVRGRGWSNERASTWRGLSCWRTRAGSSERGWRSNRAEARDLTAGGTRGMIQGDEAGPRSPKRETGRLASA